MPQQVSPSYTVYLTKEFVLPRLYQIMDPYLAWIDIFPKVAADSRAVRVKKDNYSDSTDPLIKKPVFYGGTEDLPMIDVTSVTIDAAILKQKGFGIQIDRDAIRFTEGIDVLTRTYNRVAYWLAKALDTEVASQCTADGTTSFTYFSPPAVWDAAGATPVADLINLSEDMVREGYPYKLTDVYLEKANYYELLKYLVNIDIGDAKQREVYGMPDATRQSLTMPVIGADVHMLQSGLTHGYLLGLDRNNLGATIFYNNDPMYSMGSFTYQKSDGTTVTVPNIGLHMHQWVDDKTHNTIMQFWWDCTTKVLEPYSVLYGSGL
jgi:hypothetical protein